VPEISRVDKFRVPQEAREEFWVNVRRTHGVQREQEGFVDDVLLEKHSGDGVFDAVTIVRWAAASHLRAARRAVEEAHRARAFSPAAFFGRAGITADLANYVETDR
jgi:heme-degrading monooxygenase HmoA